MFNLEFEGATYRAAAHETVLEALLRNAVAVPYSCCKGICQTCLLRSEDPAPPGEAQRGLRAALRDRGLFLACQCTPRQDMRIARAQDQDAQPLNRAVVLAKDKLTPRVCRLRLQTEQALDYRAGQFVNLRRGDGTLRSYSLASVPGLDRYLEIHVKRHVGGAMSNWIFDTLECGTQVDLLGPLGECHYRQEKSAQPLLLIGTSTGVAPLLGIVRDALESGHGEAIHLYHGDTDLHGLYARQELRELEINYRNFRFHGCLSGAGPLDGCVRGRANDVAFREHLDLGGWSVFLCGNPPMVHGAKKMSYLLGARLSDIHADPFELQDLRHDGRGEQIVSMKRI